ncbi:MAG: hypothetical protein R3C05_25860 [Pirellulaceae bacterium]
MRGQQLYRCDYLGVRQVFSLRRIHRPVGNKVIGFPRCEGIVSKHAVYKWLIAGNCDIIESIGCSDRVATRFLTE